LQIEWEKRDREEVTAEKEATLGAAEEVVVEVMVGAEQGEVVATAAAEAAVVVEGMIADPIATAGRTETADQHQWKKAKKSMSP
jgi:hypothetical protein